MTPAEYIQLKAFARQDGALLALLWVGSFACYILGLNEPFYGTMAVLLVVLTPFLVARRLRNFRDYGLEGVISFRRGWGFVVLTFFYASVLFAIAQYAYFAYIDKGFFMDSVSRMLNSDEARQLLNQYGMNDMSENVRQMQSMRPIDLSLNVLTTNLILGVVLGVPISAVMQKRVNGE